jgi:hypothetical protein
MKPNDHDYILYGLLLLLLSLVAGFSWVYITILTFYR